MKIPSALLLSLALVALTACHDKNHGSLNKTDFQSGEYTDEFLLHLDARQAQLKQLLTSQEIKATLVRANEHLRDKRPLLNEHYQLLNQNMQKAHNTYDVQLLLYNACAIELKQFQADHPAFAEIFITDVAGMNICQTNMSTDFYQANESWWQNAYDMGRGKFYYGDIEYDDSAAKIVTPIYMPIYENRQLIGIAKALIVIDDIHLGEF